MSTIRPEFHSAIVSQLLDEIFYHRSNYYYFLGKIAPWTDEQEPPEAPINSGSDDITIRDNMLYLRLVQPNDVSLVTASYEWISGQVYDAWDDHIEMEGKPFYVITTDNNVYKCLDNNNGVVSTVMPTTNTLFPFRTSDGYLWKYMYNVPAFKRSKFHSRGYVPVQKALTDSFYSRGAVEGVTVTNPGSGYTDAQLTTIIVTGTTTGSGAVADITAVGPLGQITLAGLSVSIPGSNYTNGARISIASSTGSGAVVEPVFTAGALSGFTVVSAGTGYSPSDTITVYVGGAELIPVVSRTTGSITSVRIINPGAGYSATPTLTIAQTPSTGSGAYGNPNAVVKAVVYNGSIVNVTIEDPGVDYPADTSTTITIAGDGTGAQFTPVVYDGELVDVIVDEPGLNYTYMTLSITGTGEGAVAEAVLATSDFLSDQSQVEQVAVKGAIYSCVVTNPGDNYSEDSTLTITGDGTGAAGYVIVSGGGISQIVMTSYGSGYTYANLSITDPNRVEPNSFTDMVAYAILPPPMGHGYDAVKELFGDTLCIFNLVKGDVELNLIEQDYRQYGLLRNPTNLLTSKKITDNTNFVTFKIIVADALGMAVDDILDCNGVKYRVVDVVDNLIEVQQLRSIYTVPGGVFVDDSNQSIQYTIVRIESVPTLNKYSGNLMYVTNSTPFTPTSEQTIAIRTYIKL